VICAEGYVFELERRGYLQAGGVRAGGSVRSSEVVRSSCTLILCTPVTQALTYYGIAKAARSAAADFAKPMNRAALKIAKVGRAATDAQPETCAIPTSMTSRTSAGQEIERISPSRSAGRRRRG
jgi:betaine-homocysteine S-methyltransferase